MGIVNIQDPNSGRVIPFRIAGDQPSDTEMQRIQQFLTPAPAEAPAAEEPESQGNFFTGLGTGFAGSFAQLPGGITALGESVLGYTPGETAIGRAGQAISEAGMEGVEGIFGPQGDGWGSKIGQGIGSLTSFIVPGVAGARAAGALGRGAQLAQAARGGSQEAAKALGRRQAAGAMAATTPMGAGLGASDQLARIEQYVAQGGSVPDEDIRQAVRLGGAVGLTEAFPVSRIIDRSMDLLRKVPREARDQALATIGKRLRRAGRAGLEEGGQEVFAGIAQDLIEQGIYNPDAQIGQSAVDDMVVGGTAGGALQYLLDTLTRRQMATFESDATKEEQQNEDLLAEMDVLKQRMANAQENAARRAGPQALSGPEERLALPAPPGQLPPPPAGLPAPPEGPAPAPGQIEQQGIAGLLPRPTDFTAGREGVERAPGVSFPDRTKSQEQRDAEYARGIPPSEPVPPQGIAGLLPRPSDFTAGQEGVQRTPGVSIPETPTRPQLQEELDAQYARAREAEEARIAQENKSPETPSLPSGRTVGQNRPPKAQAEQVKALQEAARRPERATEEEIGASVEAEVQAEEVPQQKQQVQQIEAIQQALKEKRKPRVKASETAVKRVKQAERRAPKAVVDDVAEQTAPEPEGWSAADLSSRVVRKRDEVRKYTEDFNQVAIVDSPVGEWVIERVMGGGTQPTGFHVRHATDPDTEGVWVADTQKDAIEDVKARLMMDGYIPTESEVMGQRSEPRRERLKAIAQERAGQKPANKRRSQIGRMQEAAQSPFTAPPELVKRMRTRLNRAGLSDVGVEIEGLLLDDNGNPNVSIEGAEEVRDAKSAITLALDIYDPNMSDAELSAALGEVLSHEMVHAFRSLDLMTPEEYLSLQKAARENKVVRPDGQKREYSYLDYANAKNARFNMGLKPDQVMEEAIAEMYRAYTRPNNPLKLTGKPRSWWKKAIDFIKGIGRAGNDTGYIEPERVFESMSSGEMGARARGERRQGPRPDVEPSAPDVRFSSLAGMNGEGRRPPKRKGAKTGVELKTNFAKMYTLAKNNQFQKGRDFKVKLQELARQSQKDQGIDLTGLTDENAARLSDFLFEDAMEAAQDNANAIGWYDRKVTAAKKELSKIYPEIGEGGEPEFAFIWALAVTSNGTKVNKNFELAADVYDHWWNTGSFPLDRGIGEAAKAINNGLKMYNTVLDRFDGNWEAMRDFMVNKDTVRNIEAEAGISISGEGKGAEVRGAAILGPKIGNGFFSNLFGHFDGLTMDRWLMRSVGRWRGTLIQRNEKMEREKRDELSALFRDLGNNSMAAVEQHILKGLSANDKAKMPDLTDPDALSPQEFDQIAQLIAKAGTDKKWRTTLNELPNGESIRKVANALSKYLDGQVEAPGGTKEREFLRKVFTDALGRLQSQPGMDTLTMADLQALIWYPEKLLYETAKKPRGEQVRMYEDDDAPDYENAARNLVQRRLGEDRPPRQPRTVRPRRSDTTASEEDGEGGPAEARPSRNRRLSAIAPNSPTSNPRVRDQQALKAQHTIVSNLFRKALDMAPVADSTKQKAEENIDRFMTMTQDSFLPVGKLIDSLREAGVEIRDALDPYLQEINSHGLVGAAVARMTERHYEPALTELKGVTLTDAQMDELRAIRGETVDGAGSTPGYFSVREQQAEADRTFGERVLGRKSNRSVMLADAYLYALHAPERNAYVLDKKGVENGSGMSDREAQEILDWIENNLTQTQKDQLNKFRGHIRSVVSDTNRRREQSGLLREGLNDISIDPVTGEEVYDNRHWKQYVPLKGVRGEDLALEDTTVTGTKRRLSGREDRQIKGRTQYAGVSPTLFAMTQNSQTIQRSEMNKVVQSYANLIRENPDLMDRIGRVFERAPRNMEDPRLITFKEDGQTKYILAQDSRIARAFDKTMNPDSSNALIQNMYKFNRALSQLITTFNPEFLLTNAPRDVETALVNASQYEIDGLVKDIYRNLGGATKTLIDYFGPVSAFKGKKGDRVDRDPDWSIPFSQASKEERQARLNEFIQSGGKQMTNPLTDLEGADREIKGMVSALNSDPTNRDKAWGVIKRTGDFMEAANEVGENASRFSMYVALREKGVSKDAAASASRNLTTNFSKKGEFGTFLGAWSLFYNASLQGSMAMVNAAARSKTARKALGATVFAGFIMDQVLAAFSEEDEDGILAYDKMPEWELEHNVYIPTPGGGYVTVPLAYGLNSFYNLGRNMSKAIREGANGNVGDYGDMANSVWGTLLEIVNPFGDDHSAVSMVSPTIADPFVNLAQNKDFTGRSIYMEQFPNDPGKARAYQHWNSTSPVWQTVAQTLNDWTGGNEIRPGFINHSPDTMEYLYNYYTGGLGRFVDRTLSAPWSVGKPMMEGTFDGSTLEALPAVRRLYAMPSTRGQLGVFLDKFKKVQLARAELKAAIDARDEEWMQRVRDKYGEELRMYAPANSINSARRKISDLRESISENPDLTFEEKARRLEKLLERETALIMRGTKLMEDL